MKRYGIPVFLAFLFLCGCQASTELPYDLTSTMDFAYFDELFFEEGDSLNLFYVERSRSSISAAAERQPPVTDDSKK